MRLGSSLAAVVLVVAAAAAAEPPSGVPKPEKPAGRCVTPTGDPIAAETILETLREGTSVDLQGKIIEGNLDAERFWGPAGEGKSSLRVVRGSLRLDSCRITGHVTFPRTVFVQDLILSCAELGGDLDLTESEVRGSLLADRSQIAGDVRLTNASLGKDLSFKQAALKGRLDMSGTHLLGVNLQECQIERSLDMTGSIAGLTDLSLAKIGGPVKLNDTLLLGALNARDAAFGRAVTLSSVGAWASIDLGGGSVAGDLSLSDVSIERNLVLPKSFGGWVELSAVTVGHDLSLAGGSFLDVRINGLTVRGGSDLQRGTYGGKLDIGDADFGKTFTAKGARFDGPCEFRKVLFAGTDPMAGAKFAVTPTLIETKLPRLTTVAPGTDRDADGSADEKP
jgi:hypothetical protein